MISNKILKVLRKIAVDLEKNNIKWVLVGSLSLALNGVDVIPHDIDIVTTKEGALKLNEIWREYIIKKVSYSETDLFRSYYGKFKIDGVPIEVMGELEAKVEGKWISLSNRLKRFAIAKVYNVRIPITRLEDHLESYSKSKREKDKVKADKIKKRIAELRNRDLSK